MKTDIGNRIKEKRESMDITQTELANRINSTKQNIYKYENGIISNIPSDKIESIAKVLKTSPAYLMGWIDDPMDEIYNYAPIKSISMERFENLSDMYFKLQVETDPSKIGKILRRIKRIEKLRDKIYAVPANYAEATRINVLGSVPAGIPLEAVEDIVDWEDIPKEWTKGGQEYIGLRVKGDSMYPKYLNDDTVIVRLQEDCETGQDCVVYVNGYDATLKKVVKKIDCMILQPLNPSYDPQIYDYNDETHPVKVLGVIVEIRRKV